MKDERCEKIGNGNYATVIAIRQHDIHAPASTRRRDCGDGSIPKSPAPVKI